MISAEALVSAASDKAHPLHHYFHGREFLQGYRQFQADEIARLCKQIRECRKIIKAIDEEEAKQ